LKTRLQARNKPHFDEFLNAWQAPAEEPTLAEVKE